MRTSLDDVLLHGQNAATLEAAHTLLRTLSLDRRQTSAQESSNVISELLDEKGFSGLWRSCSIGSMDDHIQQDYFQQIEKLIEVGDISLIAWVPMYWKIANIVTADYYLNSNYERKILFQS